MKNKVLFLLTPVLMLSLSIHAQRGVSLAYIDSEYILENVPEYQEATLQLNAKADKWKNEIQEKLARVEQKRQDLSNEKALLTAELIKEREEDITFEENEILDYQQKRFGPNGDLFIQNKQLMQPVQDQIFAAVQTLVAARKYQLVLDKANGGMLYVDNSLDISDQILRSITRTSKRTQAQSKAERKAAEREDIVPEQVNTELEARQKALEEKKSERESALEAARQKKLAAREAKVKAAAERRQKILDEREKAKQASSTDEETITTVKDSTATTESAAKSTASKAENETKTKAEILEENRQKKLKAREERKKALEAKKQKILEERQKAKDSLNNN